MSLWSNVIWAQGGDHLGRPPMDLGFPFEILWEPAAPRLDQCLLRLRLMPKARSHESSIPSSLEFWADLGARIGHGWFLIPCTWVASTGTASDLPVSTIPRSPLLTDRTFAGRPGRRGCSTLWPPADGSVIVLVVCGSCVSLRRAWDRPCGHHDALHCPAAAPRPPGGQQWLHHAPARPAAGGFARSPIRVL
jgi:hypothetical protein